MSNSWRTKAYLSLDCLKNSFFVCAGDHRQVLDSSAQSNYAAARNQFQPASGAAMKARAAVAWEPKKPLQIEEVDVEGPREGEVLLKVHASGVCHTDAFTLSGEDPEGAFPAILGHEGGCEVLECGPDVKNLAPGDHVIPLYIPECGEPSCGFCSSNKNNLCQSIAGTVWTGFMPDGTRRFRAR